MNPIQVNQRIAERKQFNAPIEFIVEGDVIDARSVDVSENGIRFETDRPLRIALRFAGSDHERVYDADLVWAKREEDGESMAYGLRFR
jgi:hypothetical protein